MRIALAHDYLTQRGGAERVTAALTRIFDQAPLYTSVYEPSQTFPEFRDVDIRTSPLQSIPIVRRDPRIALPLLAAAWSRMHVDDVDTVIASSSGWSHALQVSGDVVKIVYCHNPARWIYQSGDYLQSRWSRYAFEPARVALERWDKAAASTADVYVANSWMVAQRIEKSYGFTPEVLHPPVSIDVNGDRQPIDGLTPGFWLTVARGRTYKNVAAVVDGVKMLKTDQLAIVGTPGQEQVSSKTIRWLGVVTDSQLRWLYSNARGLVSVSHEDFGLTPLEANAFGTPVAVLRGGGFLDSLAEGTSGVFIESPTAHSVYEALKSFPSLPPEAVALHAKTFDEEAFGERLRQIVAGVHAVRGEQPSDLEGIDQSVGLPRQEAQLLGAEVSLPHLGIDSH